MTHIFVGCDQLIGRRSLYFSRLSALEVHGTAADELKPARLAQWRTESPKGFAFSMVAHTALGGEVKSASDLPNSLAEKKIDIGSAGLLKPTDATREIWKHVVATAEPLSPKTILVRTPMAFTPSAENRQRLEWFAKELAPMSSAAVAWEPHGLWDLDEAIVLARKLKLVPVFDPFSELETPPGRGTAYFVLHQRRGLRVKFDDFDMEDLLEKCEPYQRAIVVFRGQEKYRDARLFHTVWDSHRDA
jgi:uncharacterized protein YecE (DUF72 family)